MNETKHTNIHEEVEELFNKYTELLIGDVNDDVLKKVKTWSLFTHMNKTMPPLVKHWLQENPDAKEQIRQLIEEVQTLNKKREK